MNTQTAFLFAALCLIVITPQTHCTPVVKGRTLHQHSAVTGVSVRTNGGHAYASSHVSLKVDGTEVKKEVHNEVSTSLVEGVRSARAGEDVFRKGRDFAWNLGQKLSPTIVRLIMDGSSEDAVNSAEVRELMDSVGGSCVGVLINGEARMRIRRAQYLCQRIKGSLRFAISVSMSSGSGQFDRSQEAVKQEFLQRVMQFVGPRAQEVLSASKYN